jgi:hypothetical protein
MVRNLGRVRRQSWRVGSFALGLVMRAETRLTFVVFGGLLVLSSSSDLSPLKIGYLAGVGLCLIGALWGCYARGAFNRTPVRRLLITSLAAVILFCLTVIVAAAHGSPFRLWLRDVAPFMLFASVPILAIDASQSISQRVLTVLFIAAAAAASGALILELLSRREIIAFSRVIGLPSPMLPIAIGSYAASMAFQRKRWLWWAALGTVMLSELTLAGSRSGLAALLVPVTVMALSQRPQFSVWQRAFQIAGLALLLIVMVEVGLTLAGLHTFSLTTRVLGVFHGVGLQNQSLWDRKEESRLALVTWLQNPIVGTGPGHIFVWFRSGSGMRVQEFNIDTGISFLSKFGALGLVILAMVGAGYKQTVRACLSLSSARTVGIALIAYAIVAAALLISLDPIEDKGFSFGLIFVLALAIKAIHADRQDTISSHDRLPVPDRTVADVTSGP